jgi:MFS family permease
MVTDEVRGSAVSEDVVHETQPRAVDQFRALPRPARVALGADLSLAVGFGLVLPFFLVYLHQVRGMSVFEAGAVLAWNAACGLATAPLWGRAIDRYGPRINWIAALTIEAVSVVLLAGVTQLWQAFGVATLMAAGGGGAWPAGTALFARLVPSQQRTWLFGVRFAIINLGVGVGGLVAAGLVSGYAVSTFQRLYLVCAATYVLGIGLLLSIPRSTGQLTPDEVEEAAAAEPVGYRHILRDRVFVRLLVAGLVLVTFGYAQLESGFTAYVTQVSDVPARWLGVSFGFNTAAIVIAQLVVLKLIAGRSRTRLLALVGVLWAVNWVFIGSSVWFGTLAVAVLILSVAGILFGLGETLWAPLFPALVNELAVESARGRYNAAASMVWNFASVVGPLYAGAMIGAGLGTLWVLVTTAGCLVGAAAMLTLRRRLTRAQDGRTAPAGGAAVG